MSKLDMEEYGNFIEAQLTKAIGNLELDLPTIAKAYLAVFNYFNKKGQPEKTWDWFVTSNPMLGGKSPFRLCLEDKADKVLNFIKDSN